MDLENGTPVSIDELQYKNLEQLASLLKNEETLTSYLLLKDMAQDFKEKSFENYHKKAEKFIPSLEKLSIDNKKSVNDFFASINVDLVI